MSYDDKDRGQEGNPLNDGNEVVLDSDNSNSESKSFVTDEKVSRKDTQDTAWNDAFAITLFDEAFQNPDDLINKKGAAIYREMMRDEQVKAVVRFKRDAITARDWFFDIEGDELSEEEQERRIAISKAIIDQMDGSFTDALNGVLSSMYNGFSLTEKVLKPIDVDGAMYWGIEHLRTKPYDTFRFHTDRFGNLLRLVQKVTGDEIELERKKFIHFVQNPDVDEWYGQSELREAHRSWFSKKVILRIQNIYLERMASGLVWIQPPEGRTIKEGTADHSSMMDLLRNIQAGSGILLPHGFTLNVQFPANEAPFDTAIAYHDLGIAKALLVPNLMGLSHQGSVGSFAQAQTQLEGFLWMLDADKERLQEALNEQLFRPLGRVNFGDEHIPEFKLKPLSKSQLFELARAWMEMVTGGAVQASDTDEQHLRDMLGFPARAEEDEDNRVSADNALQGQQITAMMDIIKAVGTGAMKASTAVELLVASFPLSREQAEAIVADIEVKEPEPPPVPGETPGEAPGGDPGRNPDGNPGEDPGDGTGASELPVEETIIGRGIVSVSAFNKATRRVDFAVIQNRSEALEAEQATILANRVEQMLNEVGTTLEGDTLGNDDLRAIQEFDFSSEIKRGFRSDIRRMLNEAWRIGERHARSEIDKAKGESFSISFKRDKLTFIAEEFFDIKSFSITGSFTSEFLSKIKNLLLNGAKGGKSTREVREQIIEMAASEGVVSREFAEEELGRRLDAEANPMARLNNIVRTNTFEAINEARFAFFTDPQVDDFVEALEYSAILDSRTTSICEHLDGRVFRIDSDNWESYRPPNHFQCRSLLIPVTVVDEWTESEQPTVRPQRGFG